MRKIKFRCWDKLNKIFIDKRMFAISNEGDVLVMSFSDPLLYSEPEEEGFIPIPKEDKKRIIIMQYTGLKDKNGKEVWEGDIVRYDYDGDIAVVELEEGNFRPFREGIGPEDCEVIGNIYENKELLTNKQDT